MEAEVYRPRHKVRFVTAASLFDGHDAAINIIRRLLQASGAEVIHLGHNRSVQEIVDAAIQEDVQGIAVSSYQGGHMEFFKYMIDLLRERGASHIRVFGGGGGVIVPEEIRELEVYGVCKIFSPEDGRRMGLQGMVNYMLRQCDFPTVRQLNGEWEALRRRDPRAIARLITYAELHPASIRRKLPVLAGDEAEEADWVPRLEKPIPVIGITGTGGAGKSSLVDELLRRFLHDFPELTIGVLSVDPSQRRTGGALLGDRIRMNTAFHERVYMRSLATRASDRSISQAAREAIEILKLAGFDLIILETSGIGQADTEIVDLADITLYVMTPEYGAPSQLEKINMLDLADLVVLNKFEKRGALDALRDVRKQLRRNRGLFQVPEEELPVYPTIASQFEDPGTNRLYVALLGRIRERFGLQWHSRTYGDDGRAIVPEKRPLIPPHRERYLAEIADTVRRYHRWAEEQVHIARRWGQVRGVIEQVERWKPEEQEILLERLRQMERHWAERLDPRCRKILEQWDEWAERYRQEEFTYLVRGRPVTVSLYRESLSGLRIPRVALPKYEDWGERLRFALKENLPGYFPYTAGVYPFKREEEDPTRMFAGEGTPERTNRRFHYLSYDQPAKRLSTAFDSVTLYGYDPDERPDIYGKVGNSGVSICTIDDMKKLYSGFDLCDPKTSVSMTINGPAPMILAMFLNTAIDQQVERWLREQGKLEEAERAIEAHYARLGLPRPRYEGPLPQGHNGFGLALLGATGRELVEWGVVPAEVYEELRAHALHVVRGTVQADILKEDQAQNTCIFSTEFALRLMGDIQEFFIRNRVRNFYSVSISGYHIAEAGANPITQLAFTLANAFTYVEYYLARGMQVDDFAPNLSFFFSNGMDPEYTVIGRVARRIWAIAMRDRYGASERSQMLKYHIQTSGRSLHAMEIAFNDIRTTLQALLAIFDNCNSLHTNAYDEAITTPTEESVRRAMAIQLIINKEFGLAKNENPWQGSFIIEELTDLVEEAVLREFERLTERGGVLGAMETMYQRNKIQEESLYYEQLKHSGQLPIVGVNTFVRSGASEHEYEIELVRSTEEEKQQQLRNLRAFWKRNEARAPEALERLKAVARSGGNLFQELMYTVTVCSLGQITRALFEVGGQYRRNM
mgnify:CR=1 FL=1|jgi:methylmalonyl-CoA mutase